MSNRKVHKPMERLDKIYNVVLQSSTKGIRAVEIAGKLNVHKTMVYRDLNSLYLMGKVESDQGIWHAKAGEQTIKPLEKEITIELPLPKKLMPSITGLELLAEECRKANLPKTEKTYRILIEKERETRTIRIKGKNVEDLELEKLGNLIQQANAKSFKVNLRGLLKGFKKPIPNGMVNESEKSVSTDVNTSSET